MEKIKEVSYGNVKFTQTGIEVVIPYGVTGNIQPCFPDKKIKEALECAKSYVKGRMKHCLDDLQANASKATYVEATQRIVEWETGHFSGMAYDAMKEIESIKEWDDLSILQLDQILKALHEGNTDKYYEVSTKNNTFCCALESLICKAYKNTIP